MATANKQPDKSSAQAGLKAGDARKTFIVSEDLIRKIRVVSALQGLKEKDILNEALTDYFAKYEKKNGAIPTLRK